MNTGKLILKKEELDIEQLNPRVEPRKVLMCPPTYFEVLDVKNIYMGDSIGKVDSPKALQQWKKLESIYIDLVNKGLLEEVSLVEPAVGCEDMVFAANQSFPWVDSNGKKMVVMSNMFHASRALEVPYFEDFYKKIGYQIFNISKNHFFEGMGDTIPHPQKELLYGGYGHRTTASAYAELATLLNVPVVLLKLVRAEFYHLDTCFLPIDNERIAICKEAFDEQGLDLIHHCFSKVYEIPLQEAASFFALNAHIIPKSSVASATAIIQKGSEITNEHLKNCGLNVLEVDTSEFMKSGGSVFCMKMMYY